MPLTIIIEDSDLTGLSPHAQTQLKSTVEQYSTDLLSEANRIEAASRAGSLPPEVSAQMIHDAATYVRKGMVARASSPWAKGLRAFSALLSLLLGLAWDQDSLQSGSYLIWFGVLLAVTLITTTIVSLKD